MHHYLLHLLRDIAAAARPAAPPPPPAPEHPFAAAERYLHEEPELSLGQHCGLKAGDFPPAERLTEAQQQAVVEALEKTYFSYNVGLALPEELPTAMQYRFYVEALEEKCFVDHWGDTTIEYCEDDPELCPFGWKYCNCLDAWLDMVEAIRSSKPPQDWTEEDYLEDCWLTTIMECDESRMELESGSSPNKRYVLQLLADIEQARIRFVRADGWIRMEEPEEEAPGAGYRPFFEWLDMPDVVFPPEERLSETEVEALGYALLRLYGKDTLTISLLAVSAPVRYRRLAGHFTMPMRRVGEMQFLIARGDFDLSQFPDLLEEL